MEGCHGIFQADRLSDESDRDLKGADLYRDNTQHMKAIGVGRIVCKYFLITLFGFRQPPGLMMLQR